MWLRAIESVGLGLGLYWLGCPLQEGVQVASFEESVAIGWIAVHRDLAKRSPFTDGIVGDAHVLRCCGCVQVFGQFVHVFCPYRSCVSVDRVNGQPRSIANPAILRYATPSHFLLRWTPI